ncbi:MAG: DUF3375 family protein [Planctomycetota bacterium]
MEFTPVHRLIETSPAIRLLASQHAAFVLFFLHRQFKGDTDAGSAIDHDDLRERLSLFQQDLREDGFVELASPADTYLTAWSDQGWLRRFLTSDSKLPKYQLTRHAEDALRFVDSLLTRQSRFVGTESRLRLVIETLTDIVRGASTDPDRRLEELRRQRDEVQRQIDEIAAGGVVRTYKDAELRDRFQTALELLKTLQGDFRAVEDRFAEIAREVHSQTQTLQSPRGRILSNALDAEELVRKEDEGVSFYAFVAFLFSPRQQEHLRGVLVELAKLESLREDRDGLRRVRGMLPALLAEAENVLRQNGRLSETLRRLLDTDSIDHRRRLAEVLREAKSAAASLFHDVQNDPAEFPSPEIGLEVATMRTPRSIFSRSFWSAPQTLASEAIDAEVDLRAATDASMKLAALERLEWRQMRTALAELADRQSVVSFQEIVAHRPPRAGMVELIGWLQIAHQDGHSIDESAHETILVDLPATRGSGAPVRTRVRVPVVRFQRDRVVRVLGPGPAKPR